ncbi:hypothetical protein MHZ95_08515 [Sporosarcina sp. ACRSM]|uniref:hypothetical protein n=1 Tax=Sporosarcina sp. ACRSM TaxID=2918216 RepID=UPI001EF4AC79|nr:hypothetical protein [Sporosarcina sp. ACRSM]MCG7335318.1 hypothetical protein [Sporosarcina sp. ACRSM]
MEYLPIDPAEMELRQNKDFMAILKMIGEGSPVYEDLDEVEAKPVRKEFEGYDESQLPKYYQ